MQRSARDFRDDNRSRDRARSSIFNSPGDDPFLAERRRRRRWRTTAFPQGENQSRWRRVYTATARRRRGKSYLKKRGREIAIEEEEEEEEVEGGGGGEQPLFLSAAVRGIDGAAASAVARFYFARMEL